jgi:cytochrome c oxidase assembly protein subunit 15
VSAVVVGLIAVLSIGMTGTVAALSDTLFPATSLAASVLRDFASESPGLLHFRLVHPVLAVIAGTYVIWLVLRNSSRRICQARTSLAIIMLLFTQIGIGLLNVLLLARVWLQILHLLVADTIWILLVLASAAVVLEHPYARSGRVAAPSHRIQRGQCHPMAQHEGLKLIDR